MKILYKTQWSLLFRPGISRTKLFLLILFIAAGNVVSAQNALDFPTGAASNTNYVSLPNLIPSGSYTKEAWINGRSFASGTNNILSGSNSAFWVVNGQLCAGHNAVYTGIFDVTGFSTSQWYHVAVTYDAGTNFMQLYIDGAAVAGAGSGNPVGVYSETNAYIGAFNDGSQIAYQFDGQIDEVRVWNVVRTATEIANNRSCGLTGDEPGLLAYYRFNQGVSGANNAGITTLLDAADRCIPNNGTLVGFALNGATSNWMAEAGFGHGVAGTCAGTFPNINLVGNGNCINIGDVTPSSSDFTDFGTGTTITRTFTIQNTGNADLTFSAPTITGINASEFAVTAAPTSPVTGGGSTTFDVTYTPSSAGPKTAVVNIASNDGDEAAFTFEIGVFSILPVTFTTFNVKKEGTQSRLFWTTATEINNIGFEVQRSTNGLNWTVIGFVAGAGNSDLARSYYFMDATPVKGVNYYRLKQVDNDSRTKFTDIRTVTFASNKTLVYPVPTTDIVTIELADNRLIGTIAYLTDMQGKLVRQVSISSMQQPVSLSGLQAGMYWMKLSDGVTHKLIKQ
ncbi:MAG TPA: choice-of-anchor D domain-containing protein [Chitinophagaceae bacterium]|nr:choice-of-anchor D domain-containing protein [Chitinophagaceae bacterium]